MDDDVDMEAPSISTLPEEKTPPPTRRKAESSRKKKPKAPVPAAPFSISWRKSGGQPSDAEPGEEGEPEDEEDQLIDDEDDVATPASGKTADAAPKKKTPAKRKARKEPGTEEEGTKKRTKKDPSSGVKSRKPSGSEPTPSESLDDGTDAGTGANTPSISIVESEPLDNPVSKPAKKKGTPRKTAAKAAKGKPSGLKMVIPASSALTVPDDTASVMSEGGISGTAASSPVAGNFEKSQPGSPEPDTVAPSSPTTAPVPLVEETNLENIPLPVYPLPSKPFPVQPPPKIPTGFAPPIPLDKGGKKVRHWRTANREIRGIAGGRWFARSWVGDKDSEYATSAAAKELEKTNGLLGLPKQLASSASAPPLGRGSGKKAKGGTSVNPSAAPSRDASVVPPEAQSTANATGVSSASSGSTNATPIPITTSTVRAPTKMRIQQLPEDPDPPSDAAMDIDPIPVPPSEA